VLHRRIPQYYCLRFYHLSSNRVLEQCHKDLKSKRLVACLYISEFSRIAFPFMVINHPL
jgi:hypothetical protein